MFRNDRYKNAVILFIILTLYVFLFIHLVAYYRANKKISERAILGLTILTVFLIQRIILIYRQKKIMNFIGNPLQYAESSEIMEKATPIFKRDEKRIKQVKKNILQKVNNVDIGKNVISMNEKKYYFERITASLTNALLILCLVTVLIVYRKVLLAYGIFGIAIAMFFGVTAAAYLTKNIKDFFNVLKMRKESVLTRRYKIAVNSGQVNFIDDLIFLRNWTLMQGVNICFVYDNELKRISFFVLFLGRFFLEANEKEIINGVYESDDLHFIFTPVSKTLMQKALTSAEKCTYLDEKEKNFIKRVLNENTVA